MRFILAIFFLFLGCTSVQSQENAILDSLLNQLTLHPTKNKERVIILTDIAGQFNDVSDFEKIKIYAQEALEISEELNFHAGKGMAYNTFAGYYVHLEDYEKVVKNSLNALTEFDKIGGHIEVNTSNNLLALAYKQLHEYDKAIEIYLQTEKNIREYPLSIAHLSTYYNLADTYGANYDSKNAIVWAERLLESSKNLNSDFSKSMAYSLLARLYSPRNLNPQKSIGYAKKALAMTDSLNEKEKYIHIKTILAGAYLSNKNYAQAEKNYLNSIQYYKRKNDFSKNHEVYKNLSRMYLEMGKDEESFAANKMSNDYLVKSEEKKSQSIIKDLEVQYETDKIKREKILAEEKAVLNRNLLIASLASIFMLLLAAFFYNRQQQLKKKAEIVELELKETKNKLELEQKLRDSELKAIRAQMNPHFLFNAFNSIQEYIILNKRELASDYLGKFADLMRIYLDHSKERSIVLEDEIKAADLYLQLERIRFEDDLDFSISVADNVNEMMTSIPPMLIQPFIENALKHGLFHKKGEKRIDINFLKDEDNILICTIIDNGIGRKQSAIINRKRLQKHQSFATAATQNRIELLNVERKKDITFEIVDLVDKNNDSSGTKVVLNIPL